QAVLGRGRHPRDPRRHIGLEPATHLLPEPLLGLAVRHLEVHIRPFRTQLGAPTWPPNPPIARRAPAKPGRSSLPAVRLEVHIRPFRTHMGAPTWPPNPPIARRAPAKPGRSSLSGVVLRWRHADAPARSPLIRCRPVPPT